MSDSKDDVLAVLFQTLTTQAGMNQPEEVAMITEIVDDAPELNVPEGAGEALQKRTVLLRLKIMSYGTKVGVDTAKLITEEEKRKAASSFTSHKLTLKSNRLDKIASLDGDFRREVVKQSLKVGFLKGGMYCLPAVRAPKVQEQIDAYIAKRERLVEDYIREEYVSGRAQAEARERLGSFFDERDYPRAGAIEASYKVETKFLQLEAPTVLKDVDANLLARELEKEKEFWREAAYDVKAALRSEMQALLAHLVDRLTPDADGKQKIFRNSLLDNLTEFFNFFGDKNITGDDDLAKVVVKARSIVAGVANPDQLRDNDIFRQVVATEMAKIKATADLLVEEMPERGIDLSA